MTSNDIFRRIRYIFDLSDSKMIKIFGLAERVVTRSEVSDWLKKEDDAAYKKLTDRELAIFLNGFINDKRGKKEGPAIEPEQRLNNNIVLRKLKIALNYKDDDMLAVLALADLKISKHELSAFFRKAGHKHFRECKDQVLRHFMKGLQLKYRADDPEPEEGFKWKGLDTPEGNSE